MDHNDSVLMPFLPLRDIVVFPHMIVPLFVGRESSVKAVEKALADNRQILLLAQKNPRLEDPSVSDVYETGTVAEILQMLKLPDGTFKVLVEGSYRGKALEISMEKDQYTARVIRLATSGKCNVEMKALMRNVVNQFETYIRLNKRIPMEIMMVVNNTEEPGRLADIVVAHLLINVARKQEILEAVDDSSRLEKLALILSNEIEILNVEKRIRNRVRQQLDKVQKEYYLREQLKAIHQELGDEEEMEVELDELRKKLKKMKLPAAARERADEEIRKMSRMQPGSAEYTVSRNYVDWIISLPWNISTKDNDDLELSERILEEDHYGLSKIKERIVEYLAVRKLTKKMKGPILCFVGPPGVGKTSLGKSIARALGRKFVRFSLGGLRDEAEIRGHRRTYIGALPGKILQLIKQAGSRNPVILLDEIDKMSSDFRGDPSSALLEVLDPEQNSSFADNYLSLEFDLSDVMFLTTANLSSSIPAALFDRMEVIRLSGYTEQEKISIAKKYLIPRQLNSHGLSSRKCRITDDAVKAVIRGFTREAGVRSLERNIQGLCRKVARKIVSGKTEGFPLKISSSELKDYLGVQRYQEEKKLERDETGVVNGLAWTESGGVLLPVEVMVTEGKGRMQLTGQLGDVMKESAHAALTWVKSISGNWKLKKDYFEKIDLHIHVPEGATPKDGPSAGIALATGIASAVSGKKVRCDIGMTGEITLRGRVLAIGGLKEKLLAAYQHQLKEVIIPEENRKDMEELPDIIRKKLKVCFVDRVEQVLQLALK